LEYVLARHQFSDPILSIVARKKNRNLVVSSNKFAVSNAAEVRANLLGCQWAPSLGRRIKHDERLA